MNFEKKRSDSSIFIDSISYNGYFPYTNYNNNNNNEYEHEYILDSDNNNERNSKEIFLLNNGNIPLNNSILSNKISDYSTIIKNEKKGMLLILCANMSWATNSIYTKYVQKLYPDYYRTVPFLFFRAFMILFISFLISYLKNEKILRFSEIKYKFSFFLRTNLNFFSVSFFLLSVWYLRVSTVQIISTLNPIFVTFLSYFILKEKFYFRYIIGIILCCSGAIIIILNERKTNSVVENKNEIINNNNNKNRLFSLNTIYGVSCSLINVFLGSIVSITNKILAKNNIPILTQLVYVALSTLFYSIIYIIFTRDCPVCFGYVLCCFAHAFCFYLGNVLFNMGIKEVDLSKSAAINYTKIIFVFIFGGIFLGEKVFFTDIIGTLLILSYMLYNLFYPIDIKENKN